MVRMRIKTFHLLFMILPCTRAADIVCGGKTSETVLIGKGDSFSFKTQSGQTYQPNTKCLVKYKLRKSCPRMKFSCPTFDIKNKNKNCKGPDRMTVVADRKSKHFCQKKGPNVTTGRTLQVKFVTAERTTTITTSTSTTTTTTSTTTSPELYNKLMSDESRKASGAECVVQCYTEQDTYSGSYSTYGSYGTGSYWTGTYGTGTYTTYPYTSTDYSTDPSGISGVSELLRLLPLLRIPVHENVDFPGSWEYATISSDNILHDVTISYKGDRYNVLMEDVASIINIPQTLRNVKVFHHQGTKHFRIMRHGDQGRRNIATKFPVKKLTRHAQLIKGKKIFGMKKKGTGPPTSMKGKKKGRVFNKGK